ncbi:MAG: HAMP domain-containing sensor histidine kinase [Candidatus Limnocylindrales bacterium]
MKLFGRSRGRPDDRPGEGHAGPSVAMLTIRVAMAASAIVGIAYLAIAVVVAVVVSGNLTADVDRHLVQALDVVVSADQPGGQPGGLPDGGGQGGLGFDPKRQDPRGLPVLLWDVSADGTATGQGLNDLALPAEDRSVSAPTTVSIDGASYRVAGRVAGSQRYVVAQAMDSVSNTESTLIVAEFGIGCALLIVVFLGAVAIGRRVALPIERARRRQLEFTADASHELRTPLSVIEAQTSLALARQRDRTWDANAFGRIDAELKRTRHLVDDMLWLARFDSTGGQPDAEPVDVGVLAAQTADRFGAVAEARHQKLTVDAAAGGEGAIVTAPPDWLDRLLGVLIDNACKYSPEGGSIAVSVAGEGRRVRLTVDDSGPGIPAEERGRVFDRFHRATDAPGGAGLGLAIADAIVHATGGRWAIGTSPAGGASVSVNWLRSVSGRREARTTD